MECSRPLLAGIAAACALALTPSLASAATPAPAPVCTATACTVTFPFLQDVYTYALPTGVDTMEVSLRGASSGNGRVDQGAQTVPGAQGATVQATLAGLAGHALFVYTGGRGSRANYNTGTPSVQYSGGGWHGGGNAPGSWYGGFQSAWAAGGGGGASDIRVDTDSDANRIVVAGGAGGAPGGVFDGYAGYHSIGTHGGLGATGGDCLEPAVSPGCSFRNDDPPVGTGTNGVSGSEYGYAAAGGGGGGGYRGGTGGTAGSGSPGASGQPGAGGTSYVSAAYKKTGTSVVVTNGANGFAPGGNAFANPAPTLVDGQVVITYSRLAPSAPTGVGAVAGNGQAAITWTDSAANAVAADVTGYTATASPGGQSCTAASGATGCPITGLTNGTTYAVTVKANSAVGDSAVSSSTNVVPQGPPAAPTGVAALAGDGQAAITWTDSAASPASVATTGYTATASPGGQSCTAASGATGCPITGLTNGNTYSVTVKANSSAGDSAASAAATVVPLAPRAPVVAPSADAAPPHGTPAPDRGQEPIAAAVTAARATRITRARLLKAAGLTAPAGARVLYRVAGEKGGLLARGSALVGARPGDYRVTVTVTPARGARRARTITVRIT